MEKDTKEKVTADEMMDETDIVTGRHLKKVPQAVEEIYDFLGSGSVCPV